MNEKQEEIMRELKELKNLSLSETAENMSIDKPMTAFQWLANMNKLCQFMSIEKRATKASGSELRRWFNNGNIEVNFQKIGPEDPWPSIVKSVVMFPKSKTRRCTLIWEENITLIQVKE